MVTYDAQISHWAKGTMRGSSKPSTPVKPVNPPRFERKLNQYHKQKIKYCVQTKTLFHWRVLTESVWEPLRCVSTVWESPHKVGRTKSLCYDVCLLPGLIAPWWRRVLSERCLSLTLPESTINNLYMQSVFVAFYKALIIMCPHSNPGLEFSCGDDGDGASVFPELPLQTLLNRHWRQRETSWLLPRKRCSDSCNSVTRQQGERLLSRW